MFHSSWALPPCVSAIARSRRIAQGLQLFQKYMQAGVDDSEARRELSEALLLAGSEAIDILARASIEGYDIINDFASVTKFGRLQFAAVHNGSIADAVRVYKATLDLLLDLPDVSIFHRFLTRVILQCLGTCDEPELLFLLQGLFDRFAPHLDKHIRSPAGISLFSSSVVHYCAHLSLFFRCLLARPRRYLFLEEACCGRRGV